MQSGQDTPSHWGEMALSIARCARSIYTLDPRKNFVSIEDTIFESRRRIHDAAKEAGSPKLSP
jgi:hypothetical protein